MIPNDDEVPENEEDNEGDDEESSENAENEDDPSLQARRDVEEDFGLAIQSWHLGTMRRMLKGALWHHDVSDALFAGPHLHLITSVIELAHGVLVSSATEGILRFWDIATRQCTRWYESKKGTSGLLTLPDNRFIAKIDGKCAIWEAESVVPARTLDLSDAAFDDAILLPDGSLITTDSDGFVRRWETATWTCQAQQRFDAGSIQYIWMLDPDRVLVMDGNDNGHVWSVRSGRIESELPMQGLYRWRIAILPGSKWAALHDDHVIRIRDAEGRVVQATAVDEKTWHIFAFADGHLLLEVDESETAKAHIDILNPRSGARRTLHEGDGYTSISGAVSLPKQGLLVGYWHGDAGFAELIDSAHDTPLVTFKGQPAIRGAIGLYDGRFVTWSQDTTLRLWAPDGTPIGVMGRSDEDEPDSNETFLFRQVV